MKKNYKMQQSRLRLGRNLYCLPEALRTLQIAVSGPFMVFFICENLQEIQKVDMFFFNWISFKIM